MKVALYYYHLLELGYDPAGVPKTVSEFQECADRFSVTYRLFPPGCKHEFVVVFLRGTITDEALKIWRCVPCRFEHYQPKETDGWSSQAMREQMESADCDFSVHCVSRAYFHRPGWLKKMVDARKTFGDGIYGTMASDAGCPLGTHPAPNPHLRGSILAVDPKTFLQYPYRVRNRTDEYRIECGEWNLGNWYEATGRVAIMVTFEGGWKRKDWFNRPNTFCKGDQSNLLNWDRHTDAFKYGFKLT